MTDQDEYEVEIRRRLDAVEPPPPRLEVEQVVRIGRSRMRRRRYLAAGGAAAVVLAVTAAVPAIVEVGPPDGTGYQAGDPSASSAAPSPGTAPSVLDCEPFKLPVPDGLFAGFDVPTTFITIRAIDPTGRHVTGIGAANKEVGWPAVVWRDGTPEIIGKAGTEAMPQAVNALGTVVGSSWDGEDTYSWVYRADTMTRLAAPEGYGPAFAEAINGAGDVVGSVTGTGPDRPDAIAVWPAEALDAPRLLTTPDGVGVRAISIDDDGRVVGSASDHSGGYVWELDGAVRRLPLPDGADSGEVYAARGAWAVGSATFADAGDRRPPQSGSPAAGHAPTPAASGTPHPGPLDQGGYAIVPVRWDLRTDESETFEPAYQSGPAEATAVTVNGDLVLADTHPVVVRDGLPFVLPGLAGGELGQPRGVVVNDDGTVFAGTIHSPGRTTGVPVIWRC